MPKYNPRDSESLYARLIARIYDPVMQRLEERLLLAHRQELLARVRGQVLEVGVGTGINLPLYSERAQVLGIEPSAAMLSRARSRMEQTPITAEVELLEAGIEEEVLDERLAPGSLDYIVCTLVLCTIPELEKALQRFQAWLRPGGQLLAMEHIHDSRQPQRWLQQNFTPIWRQLAEGCHLNRPTDQLLKEAGFIARNEHYIMTRWVPFYWAVLEKPA